MSRPAMRLSTRVAVVVALLVPVAVLVAGAVLLRFAERDLVAEQDRQLRDSARVVAPFAARLLRDADRPRLDAAVEQGAARLGGGFRIESPGGDPVVVGDVPDGADLPDQPGPPVTIDSGARQWRVLTIDVPAGAARLWVSAPLDVVDDQLARLRGRVVVIGVLAALAAAGAGLLVGRRVTRPLRALQDRAAEISSSVDSAAGTAAGMAVAEPSMPGDSGVVEVDTLAETLNDLLASREAMQQRTEEALRSARSFSATAAHELRTPMMSIKTNLDVLSSHPDLPASQLDEILSDLHDEHERMADVLAMLRALAQGELLDPGSFQLVDLADVVDQAVDASRRRYPDASITLVAPEELLVRGFSDGLRLVCDNLLTNAVVHGAPSARAANVTVALWAYDDQAALTVDDTGGGLTPQQREVAFDRFQRRPGSPGSGLGLTVTAQQVRLHGGQIELIDNPDGPGTRALVRLPRSGQPITEKSQGRLLPSW